MTEVTPNRLSKTTLKEEMIHSFNGRVAEDACRGWELFALFLRKIIQGEDFVFPCQPVEKVNFAWILAFPENPSPLAKKTAII